MQDLKEINDLYEQIQSVLKSTGKDPIIVGSKEQLNKLNESEFLNSYHRCNSKTYYYLRLIKEHLNVGLVVHSESYKKDLIQVYKNLNEHDSRPMIFNINNENDLNTMKLCGSISFGRQKFIRDNFEVEKSMLDKGVSFKYILHWLTDNDIRDIILTDMALGYCDYE